MEVDKFPEDVPYLMSDDAEPVPALQEMVASPLPAAADMPVGADGRPAGVTLYMVLFHVVPASFFAPT